MAGTVRRTGSRAIGIRNVGNQRRKADSRLWKSSVHSIASSFVSALRHPDFAINAISGGSDLLKTPKKSLQVQKQADRRTASKGCRRYCKHTARKDFCVPLNRTRTTTAGPAATSLTAGQRGKRCFSSKGSRKAPVKTGILKTANINKPPKDHQTRRCSIPCSGFQRK